MSRDHRDRDEMLRLIDDVLARDLATETMLLQGAVAYRLGLNLTDYMCAGIISSRGAVTAGQLADATGVTSGAITGVIDRLEKAGFVRRTADPADRRRVVVEPIMERFSEIPALYKSLGDTMTRMSANFSDAELAAVVDYLSMLIGVTHHEAERLRGQGSASHSHDNDYQYQYEYRYDYGHGDVNVGVNVGVDVSAGDPGTGSSETAPLGDVRIGQLDILTTFSAAAIAGAPLGDLLFRMESHGSAPDVRVRNGHVSVQYGWRSFLSRRGSSTLTLNSAIPWQVKVRGGMWQGVLDLSAVTLTGIECGGGADKAMVHLGPPQGVARVELRGGITRSTFSYPPGTAVKLEVRGGAHRVTLGEQHFEAVAGGIKLQTPGTERAANRYEIVVMGGVSEVSITPR